MTDIVHLAGGYGFLQDQCYDPGVSDCLGFVDAFRFGDPPVELGEREALPSAFAPQRIREVLGELGSEVIRLVAR